MMCTDNAKKAETLKTVRVDMRSIIREIPVEFCVDFTPHCPSDRIIRVTLKNKIKN